MINEIGAELAQEPRDQVYQPRSKQIVETDRIQGVLRKQQTDYNEYWNK